MPSARPRAGGAKPEALFQPPPERPAARGADAAADARRVRRTGAPRRRARTAPAGRRPRPSLVDCCCGARPGPARRASPGCSPTRSAPISTTLSAVDERRRGGPRRRSPRPRSASLSIGTRTVLFLDEIHRFNKAQQDALLPHVEDGTITLIGATTENPYFEVNSALLSRMRVWRLEAADRRGRRDASSDAHSRTRSAVWPAPLGPDGGVALGQDAFDHLVGARGRRRAAGTQRARGRRRARRSRGHPRRRTATSRRASRMSRAPPSSASSRTTGPATATTTRSPPSSRACAATTRTARSTGSPR